MIRKILLLASISGGVWASLHLLGILVERAGGGEFHLAGEGVLLAIPVGMIGALIGGLVGGILFPSGTR